MGFLTKIFTSMVETISTLLGRSISNESFIIGIISMTIIAGIFFMSFAIFKKCKTKWSIGSCILAAVGITIAFIFVFSMICLIVNP